jgi:transcription elongation GreA/GreB family factor
VVYYVYIEKCGNLVIMMEELKIGYIYLDQEGKDLYDAEIDFLTRELNGVEDILLDISTLSMLDNEYKSSKCNKRYDEMQYKLGSLKDDKKYISNLQSHNDKTVIDVGDTVTLSIDSQGIITIKLVARHPMCSKEKGVENLNSPLGLALYKKKVRDSISWDEFGKEIRGTIVSFSKEERDLAKSRTKK